MVPLIIPLLAAGGAALAYILTRKPSTGVLPAPAGGSGVLPPPPGATPPPQPSGVVPSPNGGGGVVPVSVVSSYRTMPAAEFCQALGSDGARGQALLEDGAAPADLQIGTHYFLIVTSQSAPASNWVAVPAVVSATAPSPTMTTTAQAALGGPPAGTAYLIGADDAYLSTDSQALPQFLADHGQGGVLGGNYA